MWRSKEVESQATKIKEEVEHKKRSAETRGLDLLFLDVYHRSLRHYPAWLVSLHDRQYVYPEVREATSTIIKEPLGDVQTTEFSIGERKYKITSQRRGNVLTTDTFYIVEMYLNGEKVFSVSEKHGIRTRTRNYYTLDINAYVNESWVEDFQKIKAYEEGIRKEAEGKQQEETEEQEIEKLIKNFGIHAVDIQRRVKSSPYALPWWMWVILFVLAFLLLGKFGLL